MASCFVIQPFDGGKFDKRYIDVFKLAIEEADLQAYRVDRDPEVSIPIDEISARIGDSDACLCDITLDNPNVWFELGFAIAKNREVVLICSHERKTPFPFDVHHRNIIRYHTDSKSDFTTLQQQITARLRAVVKKGKDLEHIGSIDPTISIEGLDSSEMAALVAAAQYLDHAGDCASASSIRENVRKAGFTDLAVSLAFKTLLKKGMLRLDSNQDWNGNEYIAYGVTEKGMDWLEHNKNKLILQFAPPSPESPNDLPF